MVVITGAIKSTFLSDAINSITRLIKTFIIRTDARHDECLPMFYAAVTRNKIFVKRPSSAVRIGSKPEALKTDRRLGNNKPVDM